MEKDRSPGRLRIEITWNSIFKVLLAILLAFAMVRLWPLVELLILGILIAVALYPIVTWSCRKGWPRWSGLLLASLLLLVIVGGFFGLIGPLVYHQAATVAKSLPRFQEQVAAQLPGAGPFKEIIQNATKSGALSNSQQMLDKVLSLGKTTLAGLFDLGLVMVLAIYLMVDGPRALKWLIVYFPEHQRAKIARAMEEMGELVFAYVAGQFITSALCAGYVFFMLMILHVPMALLLGIIAGIFDILPIIGFFLSVIPAAAMGLTVSPRTAVIIIVLYGAYHLFENYFIVPKVYGKKLRLSTLAVLLAIAAAGLLAGVVGAIAVLPLVAAYPVIERLWLAPKLEPDTVVVHEELHQES